MSVNIMCLTSGGGIPIFTRHKGKSETIPFPVVASLNGVHMFGKSNGITFGNTKTENGTIVWKEFEESVIVIIFSILNDETILEPLSEAVFNTMIFFVGINELKTVKNIERLKRELRACYPVVDKLMDTLELNQKLPCTDILNYCETSLITDSNILKTNLVTFAECCSTQYACITVENCLAVATDAWWELSHIERKLLLYLITSNNNCTSFDIPVFLPQKNPEVAGRAVGLRLYGNATVTVLCGTQPDLVGVEQIATQCWSPAMQMLEQFSAETPPTLNHHSSVLGIQLFDFSFSRSLSFTFSAVNKKDARSTGEILKTFYYQSGRHLASPVSDCMETYWCSEYHKVHGLKKDNFLLCVLFSATVPTHTMRTVTMEMFDMLISDHRLNW